MRKHIQIGKRSLDIGTTARRAWNDAKLFKRWNSTHLVWWKLSVEYKSDFDCDACKDTEYATSGNSCQACCPHQEFDHYICLDCEYEKCPGDDIDAAEYQFGDR